MLIRPFSSPVQNASHPIGRSALIFVSSFFFVLFFFSSGIAGAKELLVVESDRLRVAIKSNLQTEESLAGGSCSCRIIVMTMIIIMAMMMPPTLSFSSRFPHLGGLSREAGDV